MIFLVILFDLAIPFQNYKMINGQQVLGNVVRVQGDNSYNLVFLSPQVEMISRPGIEMAQCWNSVYCGPQI